MDPVLSGSLCFLVLAVVMYVRFIREHPWHDDDSSGQRKASSPVEPDAVPFLHPQSPAGVAHTKLKLKQQQNANAPLQKAYAPGGGGGGNNALLLPAGQHYPGFLNKQPMRRRTHSVSAAAAAAVGGSSTVQTGTTDASNAGDSSAAMDQQQLQTTIFDGHNQDADRHRRGGVPHHQQHHSHLHQRYPPSSGRGQHRINFDNIDFDSDSDLDFLVPAHERRASSAAADGDSLESVPFEDHDDSGFFDLESSGRRDGDDSDRNLNFPVHSPTRRVSVGANESELLPFRTSELGLETSSSSPAKAATDTKNPNPNPNPTTIERQFVRAVAQPAQMQLEVARKARIPLFLHSPMYVKTSAPPIVDDGFAAVLPPPPRLDHFGGAELPEGIANEPGELVPDILAVVAAGDALGVAGGGGVVGGRPPGGMTPRRRDKLPASAGSTNASLHINFSELQVAELIGQGAFGTVHRATWRSTTVAVKILVSQYLTLDILEEFETEVHIMSILR